MSSLTRIIETNLGTFLLGIFLNTYLYGIVTYQYGSYFSSKHNDALWMKGAVFGLFLLDTFHTASLIYLVWYYLIQHFGNVMVLIEPVWPYPLSVFITTFTAFLTHMFLTYRVLYFTNKYYYIVLLVLSFASFGNGIACGVKTWVAVKVPSDMGLINPLMAAWLISEVVVDAGISGTLICTLAKSRTGFRNSDTVIYKLIRTFIQTGLFSGVASLLTLAFYVGMSDTSLFALFGLPISRLYTNTLMDTLLCRESLRGLLDQNESSAGAYTSPSIHLVSVDQEALTNDFAPSMSSDTCRCRSYKDKADVSSQEKRSGELVS